MKEPNKVFIINPGMGYREMFRSAGWEITDSMDSADLFQFTGGADVSPGLYGQPRHASTGCNPRRDKVEMAYFRFALEQDKPMAGICRGGQFLNVMSGGSMYQDVDGHAVSKGHDILDVTTGEVFHATSTHHQMMIPNYSNGAQLIGVACESRMKVRVSQEGNTFTNYCKPDWKDSTKLLDTEIIAYPKYRVLCFQPHPEFNGEDELAARYFDYIEQFLLKGN